ncbi:MAG TPA: hypothetical protein VF677_00060 [Flavobacterium sp.]|jgi:hypothetical protein
MPYNLLLLPVIVGYFILIYSHYFKYNTQRLSQNRIIFESVSVALIIIAIGFIIRTFMEWLFPDVTPNTITFLKIIPIKKVDYLWTVVFSCLASISLVILSNLYFLWRFKKSQLIGWAVDKNGDELEKLFKKSVDDALFIQVTLKNDKVYIGYSEIIPIPQKTNYLTLTPVLSGYRDDKKQLHITTDYFGIIDDFLKGLDNNEKSLTLNTDVIIKQDEILTAGIYEQEIFDKFNNPRTEPEESKRDRRA